MICFDEPGLLAALLVADCLDQTRLTATVLVPPGRPGQGDQFYLMDHDQPIEQALISLMAADSVGEFVVKRPSPPTYRITTEVGRWPASGSHIRARATITAWLMTASRLRYSCQVWLPRLTV